MIWGCICYDGVGTLTAVEGNINSAKYIDILDKNLWSVVVWYFDGKNTCSWVTMRLFTEPTL